MSRVFDPVPKMAEPEHGFSEEDIDHAVRFWACSREQALRQLIAEEERFRDD